jgi:hypothetical protein
VALLHEETPLTIVMVTRNDADCVGGAVRSLLAQEGGPWCIRIVDDASEDDTWLLIQDAIARAGDHRHYVETSRSVESIGTERLFQVLGKVRTPYAMIALPQDRAMAIRAHRMVDAIESTSVSVAVSNQSVHGGSIHDHARGLARDESRSIDARDLAFHLASAQTHLGTMILKPDVFTRFPPLVGARLGDDMGPILAFRGALLEGCFYVAEALVDSGDDRSEDQLDMRSRETCREGLFASLIASRCGMLQDLSEHRRNRVPDSQLPDKSGTTLVHLEASLKGVLVDLVERWTQARDELWVRGLRPQWLPQHELGAANKRLSLQRSRTMFARIGRALRFRRAA